MPSGLVLSEASLLGVQTAAFSVSSRRQAARGVGGGDTCHQETGCEGERTSGSGLEPRDLVTWR